jgi:hypothetical protein
VTGADETPAAIRYKELVALADAAAQRLRRHEDDRVAQLGDEVAAGHERIEQAEAQLEQVRDGVRKRWDEAMEELFNERWMRVTPMPEPDLSAEPDTPERPIRSVQNAYLRLRQALDMRRPLFPRRR